MYGIVKGLGYVWVGFGLGGKDDENRKELGSYLRKFKIPFCTCRREPSPPGNFELWPIRDFY